MAQEIRNIILSPEELVATVESYRRTTPHFLPDGKIVECKALNDESIVVGVETTYGNSTQRADFTFKAADFFKPLLRFCLENNIVLPFGGKKFVSIVNGSVSLQIVLRMDAEVMDNVSPLQGGGSAFSEKNPNKTASSSI
ncbi:MAG: hypothetical protein PHX43_04125 [Alphaproteobacteria bacterium]|nr:hypothetical protein [Alphaproteobacteria bacterium]